MVSSELENMLDLPAIDMSLPEAEIIPQVMEQLDNKMTSGNSMLAAHSWHHSQSMAMMIMTMIGPPLENNMWIATIPKAPQAQIKISTWTSQ